MQRASTFSMQGWAASSGQWATWDAVGSVLRAAYSGQEQVAACKCERCRGQRPVCSGQLVACSGGGQLAVASGQRAACIEQGCMLATSTCTANTSCMRHTVRCSSTLPALCTMHTVRFTLRTAHCPLGVTYCVVQSHVYDARCTLRTARSIH
jgi:hypothetical protein